MARNGQPSPRTQLPSFNNLTSREEDAANGKRRRQDADEPVSATRHATRDSSRHTHTYVQLDEDEEAYRARMRRGPEHNGRYSPPDARTHSSASLLPPTSHETRGGPDAPYESSVPLNRRRGDAAQAKASRLHIDTGATSSPTHDQLSDGRRPDGRTPIARSAPPQKMSFEAQEAPNPPFHPMAAHNHVSAVRAREGEDERHVGSPQQRSSAARPEPPRHVLAPPPASARFVPQTATLPSPAYHSTAFMRGGPPVPQSNNPPRTAGLPPQTARLPEHLRSPPSSKTQFLSLFSNFYDSLSDSRTLKATLEDQVRRSNTLLQTLQRSSRVLDATVDRRIREERLVWENRVQGLEARVRELEAKAGSGSGSSPPETKPVIAPATNSDAAPSGSAPAADKTAAPAPRGSAPSSGRKTPPADEAMEDAEEGDELQSNRDED
jgi:hypothetical protein